MPDFILCLCCSMYLWNFLNRNLPSAPFIMPLTFPLAIIPPAPAPPPPLGLWGTPIPLPNTSFSCCIWFEKWVSLARTTSFSPLLWLGCCFRRGFAVVCTWGVGVVVDLGGNRNSARNCTNYEMLNASLHCSRGKTSEMGWQTVFKKQWDTNNYKFKLNDKGLTLLYRLLYPVIKKFCVFHIVFKIH